MLLGVQLGGSVWSREQHGCERTASCSFDHYGPVLQANATVSSRYTPSCNRLSSRRCGVGAGPSQGNADAAMTVYRVCLLGPTGKVDAVQQLSAATDKDATDAARRMLERDHPWFIGFEVWRDNRRVHIQRPEPMTRTTAPQRPRKRVERNRERRLRVLGRDQGPGRGRK